MGCGASKPKLNDEPDIEGIQVPKSESGYPTPKPPSTSKKEIFSIEDCTTIHENVAKVTLISSTTYEELLAQLTKDLKTDLEKIRAIFYFIGKQNIEKQYYPGIKDPHTPRGYMKLIKLKKGNYQSFFALLCRAAGFPCMILTGKGKSVGYEVGDKDLSDLHSSWNAVYMDGQWRIVHPQWAFTGIAGYNSGRWMKIEEQGKQQREKAKASKGTHVSLIDEFWFLTDPDHFIHFCIADLKEWQLLKEPWTVDKFVDVPYFRIPYFTKSDMTLESLHKAVLVSEKGKVEIKFDHEKDCKSDITYELFFDENQSSGKLPEEDLPRCVFVESTEKEKRLIYRFHVEGVYKTTLFSGESVRSKIVSFKMECNEVSKNPNLFPINPPIGFGFGHTAKDFGLQEPSETTGIVQTDKEKSLDFEFRVDTKHELEARLRHNEFKSEDLQQYIDQKTKDDHVLFNVSVPEHKSNGEYALQIYAKEGNELKNIVNYLLTDNKDDFESESAKREKEKNRLKQQLKNAINGNDPDALEKAITEFEEAKIEDEDGDLPVAKEKLRKLRTTNRLKLQLKNAMNGNDPDALEKAITEFEEAKIEDEDGDLPVAKDKLRKLGKTQAVRRRLKNAIDGDDPDELQAAIAEFESSKIKDKDGDLPRARERLRELQQNKYLNS